MGQFLFSIWFKNYWGGKADCIFWDPATATRTNIPSGNPTQKVAKLKSLLHFWLLRLRLSRCREGVKTGFFQGTGNVVFLWTQCCQLSQEALLFFIRLPDNRKPSVLPPPDNTRPRKHSLLFLSLSLGLFY